MKRWRFAVAAGLIACASPLHAQPAKIAEAPDRMMQAMTAELIATLSRDRASGHPPDLAQVIERLVFPVFDFPRMTSVAVAREWRAASSTQREALTAEFRTLLLNTYSGALTSIPEPRLDYLPLRAAAGDAEVTVRSVLTRPGAERLTIDYEMERTRAGWKVYDVKIGGVSVIVTYRAGFAAQVRERGLLLALFLALGGGAIPK